MCYKHILVAVDLSEDSKVLVERAVALATPLQAKVSLIHIDINYAELYTGLIDINLAETQNRATEEAHSALQKMVDDANFPITRALVSSGDLGDELSEATVSMEVDLVVCGHHHDFWSKFLSSSSQLINSAPVDVLVIPIK
ncbi:universal stress protein [Aliivibrio kagoshimensis]|uniref:universal stress protein n=1 Tax=Aliivibrio kagoshimensis TaxID=2910230 RepID=UPI003D0EEC5B